MTDRPQESASPLTARAVTLGLLASMGVCLLMAYNDYYLQNTLLIGNHFPVVSIILIVVLVLTVNVAARWWGGTGLSAGELLLIWGMVGVAGGICSAGIMRYFPSWMVSPAYYTTSGNDYRTYILNNIPDWMVVSRDPDKPAVKWFMEGLPRGASIPWGLWVRPMLVWFGFALLIFASNLALVSLFYRQWSERERLIFPLVQVPYEISRDPEPGRLVNDFLRNRYTWIGAAIPCVILGINGLRTYIPGLPAFPLSWYIWTVFPDRPWSEFHLNDVNIYFSVIGLTFLLTTEIAFSLWAFVILYKCVPVFVAWWGAAGGFWANPSGSITVFECSGAIFAIAIFLFWIARRSLSEWLGRAWRGETREDFDPWSPRLALVLIVAGLLGQVAWLCLAGLNPGFSLLTVVVFLAVLLVLTRIIAEAGVMFVQCNVIAYDWIAGIFPAAWVHGKDLAVLLMQKAVIMLDLREIFMPYVMNGLRACGQARMKLGPVLWVFAATAVVGLFISGYGRIVTYHKYGGVNMDQFANVGEPLDLLNQAASYQKNPPNFEYVRWGDTRVFPVNALHFVVGGLFAGALLWLRATFLWWPLHPFGFVLCGSWAMTVFWFSIFIGWALKAIIMTFGGAQTYRRVLPLFLGLALGESFMAGFWMLVSLVTGQPGIAILPH